ncbi:MAG: hypothetical protein ACO3F2_02525 [Roseiflexaceae bacterium]
MKSYQLSSVGRRNALLLMIGAGLIWAFAVWTFQSTLNISYTPEGVTAGLGVLWSDEGLSVNKAVPAAFMLVLMLAAPLTMWNIAMEWVARYTPTNDGLRYESMMISMLIPWNSISEIREIDADSDESFHELRLKSDPTPQIVNPLWRLLHTQAYGRTVLPIHAGVDQRDDLIDEIRRRTNLHA